jgi:hypothetical protein
MAVPVLAPGAIVALVGERGLGKTTMLGDLAHGLSGDNVMRVSVIGHGFGGVCQQLAECLGSKAHPDDISAALSQESGRIIMVDDLQRLIIPAIGGLEDFDHLVALARVTSPGASWVFSIGGPAWTYLNRARGDRAIFDRVTLLPRWDVSALRDLIERRTAQAGIVPVFDPLESAGMITLDADISLDERTKRAYFAELTEYSAGNPAVALEFWRRSLFLDHETHKIVVRTYRTPEADSLTSLPQTAIFVLRTILQMEVAAPEDVERSTDLNAVVVADALHILNRMGVITAYEHGYRVTLFWYRDVRRLLERQNLLGRIAA